MKTSSAQLRERDRPTTAAGIFLIAAGLVALVIGLLLVDSLTTEFRATLAVSRSVVESTADAVEVTDELVAGAREVVDSAAEAAFTAAAATGETSGALDGLADFLDDDLPSEIEAIGSALPGVISAGDGIDATLRTLSIFGVDYSPEEPFGESLRRIQAGLNEMPAEVRAQSEALRRMIPVTSALAGDVGALADDLTGVSSRLGAIDDLAQSFTATVEAAQAAVSKGESSLSRTSFFLSSLVVLASLASVVLGAALLRISGALSPPDETVVVGDSPQVEVTPR